MLAERFFKKKRDLVGMFVSSKCDKHAEDAHDKSMKHLTDYVVNCPGNAMEATLALEILHANDKTHECDQTCKASISNCHFHNFKEARFR